jgi:hypothetical protein
MDGLGMFAVLSCRAAMRPYLCRIAVRQPFSFGITVRSADGWVWMCPRERAHPPDHETEVR